MSIPEEVWNAEWNLNWRNDEEIIRRILEKAARGCSIHSTKWQHIGNSGRCHDDLGRLESL